jgi:hypothetical protein
MDLAAVVICAITCEVMSHDPTPIDSEQIKRLVAAWRATRSELGWLLEAVGANTIGEMSASQYVRAISVLQQRRARDVAAAHGTGSAAPSSGPS